ncbi:acyltransferase family protein [Streptomyces formicae]|nr:acyltransferase family protein [Streptomyces formicae]
MPFAPSVPHNRPSARASPAPQRTRDPFFDNAKYLLVTLVVIGHIWGSLLPAELDTVRGAYFVVYLFHMPAFILLCGYFSRGFTGRPDQVRALIARVLVPYLVFTVAYRALYTVIWGSSFALTPTEPTYLLWFLVALFLWRLTTPVWQAIRYAVPVAVVISLGAGLTGMDYELALPRVLMFLPWFVLGLRLRPEHFHRLRTPLCRASAVVVLLVALGSAYVMAPSHDVRWLHMQYSNDDLHSAWPDYLMTRMFLFAVSAALVAAFFALVPTRRTPFTALGAVTMFPFLTHGLLVQIGQAYGAGDQLARLGALAVVVTPLLGVAVSVLFSSAPVRRVLRPVVEPRFPRRLVREQHQDVSTAASVCDARRGNDESPSGANPLK